MVKSYFIIITLITICLVGCVDDQEDLAEYVTNVKKTAKGKVSPLPNISSIREYNYTAQNLRSPFVLVGGEYNAPTVVTSPTGEVIEQSPRPDLERVREYLEQFPLSSFTMVGTLSKPDLSWGLIRDSTGKIHAVKVGDYIGLNSGQIIAITPDQIRLNETVPDGRGGWMQSRTVLSLIQSIPEEQDLLNSQSTTSSTSAQDDIFAQKPTPGTPATESANNVHEDVLHQENK